MAAENASSTANLSRVKTDAEIAGELRTDCMPHLEALCRLMEKARAHNMELQFNTGFDQFGRARVVALNVVRSL